MKRLISFLLVVPLSGCVLLPVELVGPAGPGLVCHKGKKTMELPANAAEAHINHGDRYGRC
mgnify:CR=1 FL=1